mmetsp:Transcript_4053/g.10351  ORF Transcript_4053/g.10351 Transcript_4053/m.10351 type:complete len:286 (+) Transcript_4053:1605-2462(+)
MHRRLHGGGDLGHRVLPRAVMARVRHGGGRGRRSASTSTAAGVAAALVPLQLCRGLLHARQKAFRVALAPAAATTPVPVALRTRSRALDIGRTAPQGRSRLLGVLSCGHRVCRVLRVRCSLGGRRQVPHDLVQARSRLILPVPLLEQLLEGLALPQRVHCELGPGHPWVSRHAFEHALPVERRLHEEVVQGLPPCPASQKRDGLVVVQLPRVRVHAAAAVGVATAIPTRGLGGGLPGSWSTGGSGNRSRRLRAPFAHATLASPKAWPALSLTWPNGARGVRRETS